MVLKSIVYYLQVRFLLSPDDDFSQTGSITGISYACSFLKYKEMLTEDPDDPMYQTIFSHFDSALFGSEPVIGHNPIIDNGQYDSEIEEFKDRLRHTAINANADTEADLAPSSPPIPSPQLEQNVSIAVTANVYCASSGISNLINNAIPPESQTQEPPPPNPKRSGQVPKKKGPVRATSNVDSDAAAPATNRRSTRQAKNATEVTTPGDPPANRATRKKPQ